MELNRKGSTRIVLLTRRLAIKLPNFLNGWQLFLQGLLANMQERRFGTLSWGGLCPVLFAAPGGFLIVMPRATPISRDEFFAMDWDAFLDRGDYAIPAERKICSFGRLGDEIVAIDYGS